MSRTPAVAVAAAALSALLTACDLTAVGTGTSSTPIPGAAVERVPPGTLDVAAAKAKVVELPEGTPRSLAGYERDCDSGKSGDCVFGRPWADVDGDGCDQRSQVLARDLADVVRKAERCAVTSGTLDDPYTGNRVTDVSKIQIDHVVPLAEMWRSGAAGWPPDRRVKAANHLGNLIAVEGKVNQRKGDKTPDEWLPPNPGYHCAYARVYVTTKTTFGLTVTRAERTALTTALNTCA